MNRLFFYSLFVLCSVSVSVLLFSAALADEGMFLYNVPPVKQVKEKYGFDLTPDFLKHLQFSTVRFANRGTGSFVSADGLVLTNHHVGARNLYELSTPENDLLEKGFAAKNIEDELKCAGLEILVPVLEEDVTDKVSADDAALRKKQIAGLEKEYTEKTKLRCEITTLYQGGKYYLYGYKIYNDIRLVFAPEESIASFGGDPDNYEYPRFCIDCSLFRAYEDGKPAKIEHFLKWKKPSKEPGNNAAGYSGNELIFVSGFPGKTDRAYTKEHLEFQRDTYFPWRLEKLFRREVVYSAFGSRSIENARRIADDLGSVQNYRKRAMGQLAGLQTPSLLSPYPLVREYIDGERADIPKGSPEARIANAYEPNRGMYLHYDLLENGEAFNCQTFKIARTLVRAAEELGKPNEERLKEYQDANLESLKTKLFSDTPIYEDVEILKLTDSLTMLEKFHTVGAGSIFQDADIFDVTVKMPPKELATSLINGSNVRDVAERKILFEGGKKAIESSHDEMIQFALRLDDGARKVRKRYEEYVETPASAAYAELAKKRFEKLGTSVYPDATFTIRLSFGKVAGYKEDDGTPVKPFTTIGGVFERYEKQKHKEPFNLPESWLKAKDKLDLSVPFDFVTTNDIVGGNSGSPMVNSKGELTGLAFDGNIYSLPNNFIYTEEQSRCVGVCSDVIIEALERIYDAKRIADEIKSGKSTAQ
ncbi:hypothetical protein FACS18942_00860 [Planctomycetales bacterium]|nr:hypothetical protein FACS18942_00860 [Planctomycetales bacterium]